MKTETFAVDAKEQGRSGKGLIGQAIGHMRKTVNYKIVYLEQDEITDKAYKRFGLFLCVNSN